MKKGSAFLELIKKYSWFTFAAFLYAVAVSLFVDPNRLAPGGMTGVAVMISHFTSFSTGTIYMLLNIPLLILGIVKFGIRFSISTVYATTLISVFTNLLQPIGAVTNDMILVALVGGALLGISIGLIMKQHGTSGGTDIIVKCLRLRFPHLKTGMLFFIIDVIIITSSIFVFRDLEPALYAGISVAITAKAMDLILYGSDGAKLIFVISDNDAEISEKFLNQLDVGVTHINGGGAYSGRKKNIIMCVLRKNQEPLAEEIVREIDKEAFMIVTSASQIYGNGYKDFFSDRI